MRTTLSWLIWLSLVSGTAGASLWGLRTLYVGAPTVLRSWLDPEVEEPPLVALEKEKLRRIAVLKDQERLRIEPKTNRARIDGEVWSAFKAEEKRELLESLAAYCANRREDRAYRIELLDLRTRKTLAQWGR